VTFIFILDQYKFHGKHVKAYDMDILYRRKYLKSFMERAKEKKKTYFRVCL